MARKTYTVLAARPKNVSEGHRVELMKRMSDLSNGGEKAITQLMREISDGDTSRDRLKAIELFLSYFVGKPTETVVHSASPSATVLDGLSSEQLEAVASGVVSDDAKE